MRELAIILGFLLLSPLAPAAARQTAAEAKLAGILAKAADYCRRLDKAALDFICTEYVEEEVNRATGPSATRVEPGFTAWGGQHATKVMSAPVDSFRTTTFLYDYQFIRKGTEVTERRDLLEKNREKIKREDAVPETKHFKFRDILFGASQLLGESAAARHDYAIVKDDRIKGEPVVVISCAPKAEFAGKVLSGRASVQAKDGAVLRIDWDPASFGSYSEVLAVAEKLKMPPAVESFTEFGAEKNGVRFPSRDVTEEAYGSGQTKFTRATTTIQYKGYRFFTVETESSIR